MTFCSIPLGRLMLTVLLALPLDHSLWASTPLEPVTTPVRTFGLGDVSCVAVSPNRRHLATSGTSGAFLWDFEQNTLRFELTAHHARVFSLCFSPDNRVLLTGGFDRVIRAWEVESGQEMGSFAGHQSHVMDLAFAPDGHSFVSAGDNTARIWSLDTGEQLKVITIPGSFVARAMFTPDGQRLVTTDGAPTNNVRVWDLASGQLLRAFGNNARSMAFVAEGRMVTGGTDFALRLWNVETGEELRAFTNATQSALELSASTNSSVVIAACQDGRWIEWDSATGTVLHNTPGDWLAAACAVPGTNQVITAQSDNSVHLRDLVTGATIRNYEGHATSTVSGMAFSPDGRYVLTGGAEATTRLWNRTNAHLVRTFVGQGAGTAAVAFSPDGSRIMTTRGHPVPMVQIWETATGQVEREFSWANGWPMGAVLSKDGTRLAATDQQGDIRFWSITNNANPVVLHGEAALLSALAFSPDGKRFASGGTSFKPVVNLWNLDTGTTLRTFELNAGSVTALDFSPSGKELLVAWEDGFVRRFDVATGNLLREIVVPAAFLNDAVFSPDGQFVLTGEGWPFFTASLWDTATGERLRIFGGHTTSVDSVAFSASGTQILTGSDRGRLWSISDLAARLTSTRVAGGLELRWSTGVLQHAPNLNSQWSDLTNAVSPWTISADQTSGFYRVRVVTEE